MSVTALAAATMLSVGAVERASWYQLGSYSTAHRLLATRARYPANMADDVHRPGYNGRLWVGRPIVGDTHGPFPSGWWGPGPESYGALDNEWATVWARVGHTEVTFSPWERITKGGLSRLEAARIQWLRENNYVGGVRTHINDLYSPLLGGYASAEPITPRATIELSPDLPRMRPRMRVQATDGAPAIVLLGNQPVRISWPQTAPADVLARAAKTGGWVNTGPEDAVATR